MTIFLSTLLVMICVGVTKTFAPICCALRQTIDARDIWRWTTSYLPALCQMTKPLAS